MGRRWWGLVRWGFFFLVCLGLGYPTLGRYDPRSSGNPDAAEYHRLVETWPPEPSARARYRVLVPYVAKPFRWLAEGRVGSWQPVFVGLLVANAIFCASAAGLVASLGTRALGDPGIGLLGATLFLLNFAIPNLFLAGMVDSGEVFALTALAWALMRDRLRVLPVLGPLGVLARETFLPLSIAFGLGWWLVDGRAAERRSARLLALGAMGVGALATLVILDSLITRELSGPWRLGDLTRSRTSFLAGLAGILADRGFWYVFVWLLPLGLPALGRLPRPWVAGSALAGGTALLLGAWIDSGGNVARSVFSAAGPALSVAAASLLARPSHGT